MAQVIDRTVGANPTGFDMRTELNNIIGALESDNSGSSEPLNPVPYMKWLDTSDATYYYYKERNHDNTAWITLFRYTVATKVMDVVSNGVVLNDVVVHKTGDETIADVKTFTSSPIVPNATTATQAISYGQAVKNTGDETIGGVKTFSSSPIVPTPTTGTQAVNKDYADLKVALASFIGTNQSLGGNGYQKLPGGLIIQWGSFTPNGSGQGLRITFPIAFPNKVVYTNAGEEDGVTGNLDHATTFNSNLTGLSAIVSSQSVAGGAWSYPTTGTAKWIAIGY